MINHWKSVNDEGLFEEMGQYKRHVNNFCILNTDSAFQGLSIV